ncbi:MAG: hypothetical protein ACXAC2_24915, partial [Candidatus Kariarchaeaceae archaeon]
MSYFPISSDRKIKVIGFTIVIFIFFLVGIHTVSFDESFGKSSEWMIPNSKKNTSMKTTQSLSIPKIV